jgi:hypothetical protein
MRTHADARPPLDGNGSGRRRAEHRGWVGTLLAPASAACYGLADFVGGLLSRRAHFTVVTFLGQIGGLLSR